MLSRLLSGAAILARVIPLIVGFMLLLEYELSAMAGEVFDPALPFLVLGTILVGGTILFVGGVLLMWIFRLVNEGIDTVGSALDARLILSFGIAIYAMKSLLMWSGASWAEAWQIALIEGALLIGLGIVLGGVVAAVKRPSQIFCLARR